MQGIVFNPHYMAYVDVGLTEYWRAIGLPYPDALTAEGADVFMVAASQTFHDAARYDDELDIGIRTEQFGTTSLRIGFEIRRDTALLFSGQATYVHADRLTRRPRPLGATLVACIIAFEPVPPARKPA